MFAPNFTAEICSRKLLKTTNLGHVQRYLFNLTISLDPNADSLVLRQTVLGIEECHESNCSGLEPFFYVLRSK